MPEDEPKKQFQRRVRTMFRALDGDKDGTLQRKDYADLAARFKVAFDLEEEKYLDLYTKLTNIWDQMFETESQKAPVMADVYLRVVQSEDYDTICKRSTAAHTIMFNIIDRDADGFINESDFVAFHKVFQLNELEAGKFFREICQNHTGRLSREEFVHKGVSYFTSIDQYPPTGAVYFYGELAP